MVGTALRALAHPTVALLRRDLPRCGWRVDEVGGELRVARFCILHRLLLDRPVAADAVGQRQDLDRVSCVTGDSRPSTVATSFS